MNSGSEVVGAAHETAGRRVGQRLERDERAAHRLVPRTGNLALAGPVLPEALGLSKALFRIDRRRRIEVRGRIGQHKRDALARCDGEVGDGGQVLAPRADRRAHDHHVWPGDGAPRAVLQPRHPRHMGAVAEAQHELALEFDAAALAHDDAHQMGILTATRRHEVDQGGYAVRRFEARLQDERVAAVAARDARRLVLGGDAGAAVLGLAEQRRKAGFRIEVWPAQPVDRTVAADQCRGAEVADQRVVFNAGGHGYAGMCCSCGKIRNDLQVILALLERLLPAQLLPLPCPETTSLRWLGGDALPVNCHRRGEAGRGSPASPLPRP